MLGKAACKSWGHNIYLGLREPEANATYTLSHERSGHGGRHRRRHWDAYQAAYEDALRLTSTPWAPWYVVPADHKWYRNLVVARIVEATLRAMDPQWPDVDEELEGLALDDEVRTS